MDNGDSKIEVRLLPFGCEVVTSLWLANAAQKGLTEFVRSNEGRMFAKKLKEIARNGFVHYESDEGIVRHEGKGVFRIGIKKSLFRMLGFYGDGYKVEFIAIYAGFYKSGTKRGAIGDDRVERVARIKKNGLIQKVHD